jgi:hypothetical protein
MPDTHSWVNVHWLKQPPHESLSVAVLKHRVWPLFVAHAVGLLTGHTHCPYVPYLQIILDGQIFPLLLGQPPHALLSVWMSTQSRRLFGPTGHAVLPIVITSALAILAAQRVRTNVEAAAAVVIMAIGVHALA